jgi:16S rRNA (cytosine967-C5)-methyltransferase
MVADFCAGAGGKTLAIGALMRNTGSIYAFDVSEKRLLNLGQRLKRSGLSNLRSQRISSEQDPKLKRLNGKFNRVLVDAPCSGFGTLRRNPDLKWRQTPKDIVELSAKQANILARAAKLLKDGGRLVYATCSLLQDENESVAEAFLNTHPDFSLVPANEVMAQQQISLDTGKYLKLFPHLHQTDGFFAAVFEKTPQQAENLKPEIVEETAGEAEPVAAKSKVVAKSKAAGVKPKAAKDEADKPKIVKAKTAKPKAAKPTAVKSKAVKPTAVKSKVSKPKPSKPKADK